MERIKAWVARDKNNSLYLFYHKPQKEHVFWFAIGDNQKLDEYLYPNVKWEDKEPTEVEITIKVK